jgi:hypothetical protein
LLLNPFQAQCISELMRKDLEANWRLRPDFIRSIQHNYPGLTETLNRRWPGDKSLLKLIMNESDVDIQTAETFLSCVNKAILDGHSLVPFELAEVFYPESLRNELPLDLHSDLDFTWRRGRIAIRPIEELDRERALSAAALVGFCKSLKVQQTLLKESNVHPRLLKLIESYVDEADKGPSKLDIFFLDHIGRIIARTARSSRDELQPVDLACLDEITRTHTKIRNLFPRFVQYAEDRRKTKISGRFSDADVAEIYRVIKEYADHEIVERNVPDAIVKDDAAVVARRADDLPTHDHAIERKIRYYNVISRAVTLARTVISSPRKLRENIQDWEIILHKVTRLVVWLISFIS